VLLATHRRLLLRHRHRKSAQLSQFLLSLDSVHHPLVRSRRAHRLQVEPRRVADLNLVIKVMCDSFISAQKFAVTRSLRRQHARYLGVVTAPARLLQARAFIETSFSFRYSPSAAWRHHASATQCINCCRKLPRLAATAAAALTYRGAIPARRG
jgi:hypothetical protein